MTIEEMISREIKRKYKTVKGFSEAAGIPYTTVRNALEKEGRLMKSGLGNVIAIFDALGLDILKTFETGMPQPLLSDSDFEVFPTEKEAVAKYRSLDSFGKQAVKLTLNHEYERCGYKLNTEVKNNVITLLCSDQAASAGRGAYLGVETFNKIKVVENELTRRAHFAVPVSGNSMEPKYHDGDILLIEKVTELQKGEIGIFTLEGEGYVKKLGNNRLISLNPFYKPITINDNGVTLNGKVIGILEPEWIIK